MQNNIGLLLTKRAELIPYQEAYIDVEEGYRLNYRELNSRVNRLANALKQRGAQKGERIAVLMMNSLEFVSAFFATAKIGAVMVPLNWRLIPDELEFILKDSGSTNLLFGSEFIDTVCELESRAGKTDINSWIYQGEVQNRPSFAEQFDDLCEQASEQEPEIGADEDDMLYIMYTSGTTGLPKGVVHTHNTALWSSITCAATVDFQPKDKYLLALPLFHVGALNPLTNCVYAGITVVVMRSFDPVKSWQVIDQEKITTMLAVPAMLNVMLQVLEQGKFDYSSIRWCLSGAAPVPETLIETYNQLGIEILQVYGLTESCGPACLINAEDAMRKLGSTGKAFFHTSVRVVDDDMNDVAPNEPGEVLVKGKHIMREYWNRPEDSRETIVDGWLKTGDIAIMDEEGYIYIKDRTKDLIISGGENIYPAELENVILAHDLVEDVAVIGQPSEQWGESPVAIVVAKDEGLSATQVLDHCKGKIAQFKLPKAAFFIDEIPRNPTGKILKRLLRDRFPGPVDI